ncbi:hypothetical protein LTR84_011167 [Exophiala bonariae]|uniref:Uncharacterized protein n=1 Tax=Exophiala bonariae TaxID=1690606 RepID=A0AAV9NKZ5_9EURO|nr:hypothetical protein LTR84_011167 [Exophiala bonariae]
MDLRPDSSSSSSPPRRKKAGLSTNVKLQAVRQPDDGPAAVVRPRSLHNAPPPTTKVARRIQVDDNASTPRVQQVECFVYEGSQPARTQNAAIKPGEIKAWLTKPPLESFKGKPPVASLRLLCYRQQISVVKPFDSTSLRAIHDALGLPEDHSYLAACSAGACGKFVVANRRPVFIYHRSNNNGTISAILQWSANTNTTLGYLLLGPRISLRKVTSDLVSQFPTFAHPLFVPTYLSECTAVDLMSELHHIHALLARVERKTRFGDWEVQDEGSELACSDAEDDVAVHWGSRHEKTVPVAPSSLSDNVDSMSAIGSVEDEESPVRLGGRMISRYWVKMWAAMDASDLDYHGLSQILGVISCRFAFMEVAISCSIAGAEFTLREMAQMQEYCGNAMRVRHLKEVGNSDCLKHRAELLMSNLKHIQLFGALARRIQVQQNVLFNLIAQDDNTLNRGIAEDSRQLAEASKRDSSAMKIIAFLTTLFLPATFVATFFGMPLFNWNEGNMADVMKRHFWIYWTVTAPLTIITMGVVGAYAWIRSRKNRLAADQARRSAGIKDA